MTKSKKITLICIIIIIVLVGLSYEFVQNNKSTIKISDQEANLLDTPIIEESINNTTTTDKCIDNNKPIKSNPTFNDVSKAGCGDDNRYIGKEVTWLATVSSYAQTGGIRFWVIDDEHQNPSEERSKHGLFWGTFLATGDDPRYTEAGLKNWEEKWQSSWISYIMDVYGKIDYEKTMSEKFLVTATINYVNCDESYDGCYIETTVKKISAVE